MKDVKHLRDGRLAKYPEGKNVPYEGRVLRILVMTELFPITQLTMTATPGPVIKDIFNFKSSTLASLWLHDQGRVLHRDISLKNLMYRKNGKAYGVLLDYDITALGHQESLSKQRIGMLLYMACDLLEASPPKHIYRHDLESLFYIMIVLTTMHHSGQMIADKEHPPTTWFHVGTKILLGLKRDFLAEIPPPLTQHFTVMRKWTVGLQILFNKGYNAQSEAVLEAVDTPTDTFSFDYDSLGGNVDFDKFQKILYRDIELPAKRISLAE
ncbi:hypothetical protein AMATHDRAFT_8583 [Amanita thiersii Skay4041]|uniref:Protein kinase domain-containing protein n=1 Tax=Amanita thiersii Skay4041 TaxID=703135 RepID=A0A2A9NDJ0_9AGAR|nr:hypothetical protein AMATHDRAFT_8583 [Amanita thiersii Skay4041]